MTPLYLLRHGPTRASEGGAPLGRLDLPVTPAGEARWPVLRAHLHTLGLQQVLCSPLQRSRIHAESLGLPLRVMEDLAEQAFGAWEGRSWSDLHAEDPGAVAALFEDPIHACPPGGESYGACARRAIAAFERVSLESPTLVLAHGGPLRALLAHHLGLDLSRSLDLAWDPFGLTRVDAYAEGRGRLVFHNLAWP